MADLNLQERLQPSLFDRLQDHDPETQVESLDVRGLTNKQLRDSVEDNLLQILTSVHLEATEDLDAFPEVKRSVLNYGVPQLVGSLHRSLDSRELEKKVRDAIKLFEPRVLDEVQVKVEIQDTVGQMESSALRISVTGRIWSRPAPQELDLRTEINLETGVTRMVSH